MCGIVAYSGPEKRSLAHELVRQLQALEYRGYDSAGVLSVGNKGFAVHKRVGAVSVLAAALRPVTVPAAHVGIAHTRWATHGAVTIENAHPIVQPGGMLALALNGIVENDLALRRELLAEQVACADESDTATLLGQIELKLQREASTLAAAVATAMSAATGRMAVVVASAREPETLVAARRGSPLFLGKAGLAAWVVSDPAALPDGVDDVREIADGATVEIIRGQIKAGSERHLQPAKRWRQLGTAARVVPGTHFEHEILAQGDSIGRAVDTALAMEELTALSPARWQRILLLGCGSAHIACLAAKTSFERWAKLPTDAVLANEFLTGEPLVDAATLVIAVSQSGETADTVAAATGATARGATLLAVTNARGSSLARAAHRSCDLAAGPELSVASTKAYTAMLVRLTLLAAELGMRRRQLTLPDFRAVVDEARLLPGAVQTALASRPAMQAVAARWRERGSFLFMGRGYDHATALEGALKLRELSYCSALGIAAGELKHGTIAVLDSGFPVVALAADARGRSKTLAAIREVQARGADVVAVTDTTDADAAQLATTIALPAVAPEWVPVVAAIPMQWLALHMATELDRNVDRPRNLAKSVTVV